LTTIEDLIMSDLPQRPAGPASQAASVVRELNEAAWDEIKQVPPVLNPDGTINVNATADARFRLFQQKHRINSGKKFMSDGELARYVLSLPPSNNDPADNHALLTYFNNEFRRRSAIAPSQAPSKDLYPPQEAAPPVDGIEAPPIPGPPPIIPIPDYMILSNVLEGLSGDQDKNILSDLQPLEDNILSDAQWVSINNHAEPFLRFLEILTNEILPQMQPGLFANDLTVNQKLAKCFIGAIEGESDADALIRLRSWFDGQSLMARFRLDDQHPLPLNNPQINQQSNLDPPSPLYQGMPVNQNAEGAPMVNPGANKLPDIQPDGQSANRFRIFPQAAQQQDAGLFRELRNDKWSIIGHVFRNTEGDVDAKLDAAIERLATFQGLPAHNIIGLANITVKVVHDPAAARQALLACIIEKCDLQDDIPQPPEHGY